MTDAEAELERLRRGVLRIARAADAASEPLPGEYELARLLDTSRPQVRRVLGALEQQGIVRRTQGAATTVDPVALRMSIRLEDLVDHSTLLSRLGYVPSVDVLEVSWVDLPARVQRNLSPGLPSRGQRAVKRWWADEEPAMIAEDHLVLPAGCGEQANAAQSIFELAAAAWGEDIQWQIATPGVESLSSENAELLALPEGSPCLTLEIIGVTRGGLRVFHAFERHHPSIVRYSLVRSVPPLWR